jgi:hypothetical protein
MINTKGLMYEIMTRIIGFLIFLVLLGIANVLTYYVKNDIFLSVVGFLNSNIWLIVIFSVIFLIGEIFGYLMFPLNIPSPLFNAVGGALLIQFVFQLLSYVTSLAKIKLEFPLSLAEIENIVIILVFIIVLVVGYVHIIIDTTRPKKKIVKEGKHNLKRID